MGNALQSLSREQRQEALRSVADSLLPHPGDRRTSDLDKKLLDAIATSLGFSAETLTTKHLAQIFEFLSKSLAQPYLTDSTIPGIRARLGDRGNLPPLQYDIDFNPHCLQVGQRFGLRRSHIEDAIYHSHRHQHISPEDFGFTAHRFPSMSIFVSRPHGSGQDAFALLVQCVREANKLTAWAAWRIYHTDLNVNESAGPLDLLEAFVNAYGVDFSIEDGPISKFVVYDAIPLKSEDGFKFHVRIPPGEWTIQNGFFKTSELRTIEVGFAYAISMPRYLRALSKRHVKVDLSPAKEADLQGIVKTGIIV